MSISSGFTDLSRERPSCHLEWDHQAIGCQKSRNPEAMVTWEMQFFINYRPGLKTAGVHPNRPSSIQPRITIHENDPVSLPARPVLDPRRGVLFRQVLRFLLVRRQGGLLVRLGEGSRGSGMCVRDPQGRRHRMVPEMRRRILRGQDGQMQGCLRCQSWRPALQAVREIVPRQFLVSNRAILSL